MFHIFTRDCSDSLRGNKTCECKFAMADVRKPIVNLATNSFIGATINEKRD